MGNPKRLLNAACGVAALMIVYGMGNALHGFCRSMSCEAFQSPALWYAGVLYATAILILGRFRSPWLGWAALVGLAVEACLIFTQVGLNMYCPACLGYTGLFALWLALAFAAFNRAQRKAIAMAGVATAVSVVLLFPLVRAAHHNQANMPFSTINAEDRTALNLLFEPTCAHCQEVLASLDKTALQDRIRLCPEAWSPVSAWKLVTRHCPPRGWSERLRCVFSTLAVVRANNAFCVERGLSRVPAVVHNGKVMAGTEAVDYLAGFLRVRASRSGSCSIVQTCN